MTTVSKALEIIMHGAWTEWPTQGHAVYTWPVR